MLNWRDRPLEAQLIVVTPTVAQRWLDGQGRANVGKLNPALVDEYVRRIEDGIWRDGSTVTFDKSHRMVDGQHRCRAVVISGIPINVNVAIELLPRYG